MILCALNSQYKAKTKCFNRCNLSSLIHSKPKAYQVYINIIILSICLVSYYLSRLFTCTFKSGFYVGLAPALVGITPYMGLNFAIYELMKGVLRIDQSSSTSSRPTIVRDKSSSVGGSRDPPAITIPFSPLDRFLCKYQAEIESIKRIGKKFLCGGLAGAVSKFAVYPLDTIKKRLQTQGLRLSLGSSSSSLNIPITHYSGIVDCFQKVVRTEGVKGLYKVCCIDFTFIVVAYVYIYICMHDLICI